MRSRFEGWRELLRAPRIILTGASTKTLAFFVGCIMSLASSTISTTSCGFRKFWRCSFRKFWRASTYP